MLAIDSARVRRGEDACQTPVFGHDCAADLMRGHVLEDHVESRARIDGVRLGHIGISHEELIAWREAHLGIESPFDIPVGENANEHFVVEHRKVPDLVLGHQPASTTQAVGDIDRVRKGSHHRRNRRDMVHADCGFKPDAVEVPPFCEGKAHPRRVQVRTIPSRCGKSRIDRCCSRKNLAIAGCSPPACGLPSWRADSGRFADDGRRMFGEMAVLIHVHPRLVLHSDEFKVRVALRALAVRMHQALCALGGHDYLRRVADNRIFLQCVTCGHETPGWRIDIARQRPKPATRNVPESDIARA